MSGLKTETIEAVGRSSQIVTQSAAAVTGLAWLTSNEFYGFIGAVVALGGLGVTWYYKRKADRRMEEEHALRMERERLKVKIMRTTGIELPSSLDGDRDTDLGKLEEANA